MKRTLKEIFKKYPDVKNKFDNPDMALSTTTENVFYELCLFIDQPDKYIFNLNSIYSYLRDEELIFAIQTITNFFRNDTDFITNKKSLYLPDEEIFNQTQFAKYLAKNGLNYDSIKIGTYYRRNKLPQEDLKIGKTPYWFESTVDLFMRQEKEREQAKQQ